MGLLDSVLGSVMNNMGSNAGVAGGGGNMMQMIMSLMQQNGGLAGVLQMLEKQGLSEQVASWVGTGANQAVSPDQIGNALGGGALTDLAGKFGIDPGQLSSGLAQYLPEVVNQLTPNGRLPEGAEDMDVLGKGLASLTGKLFG